LDAKTGERQARADQAIGLICYALHDFAPRLVAARPDRQWMDRFPDRHGYRCLPLSIANAHGWHILCPVPIEIEWNGGPAVADIKVRALKPLPGGRSVEDFCRSNFSHGIVTMHVDYIFRTDPGWDLLASGPANSPRRDAYPLTGIIEADWLPYPFTMNWQLLNPGRVTFEEGEPFCCVYPIPKYALRDCQPEIRRLDENNELARQHDAFRTARDEFMLRFRAGEPNVLKQPWQKHYFVGRHPDGTRVEEHLNKLRLNQPVDRRVPRAAPAAPPATIRRPYRVTISLGPSNKTAKAPRWDADSVLNSMDSVQTEGNVAGRARIDPQGRLVDRARTRIIRAPQDAAGCDFLVMDLLSADQCDLLREAFRKLESQLFKSDAIDPYWNDRFLWYADIAKAQPDAGRLMLDAQRRSLACVKEFYRLRTPIYADLLQIVRWNAGMFMPPHADNANPDGKPHGMAHRELASVVYLTDDYAGGELYFTALDIAIKPRRGMFVAMAAGFHHEHAVLRVESGTRLTMPSFMTFDASRADRTLHADVKS